MNPEGKRSLIAAIRRVVFTGLVILGAWFLLLWLRGHIPDSLIQTMNEEMDGPRRPVEVFAGLSYDSATWDWTRSLWTNEPISKLMQPRLAITLGVIGVTGLLSFLTASILLLLGILISRVTERPGWLARLRSILRLVLISAGSSAPTFIIGTFIIVFVAVRPIANLPTDLTTSILSNTWPVAFFGSLLPAWLLVQAGHGELTAMPENTPLLRIMPRLGISLIIRLLRLVGVIIVVNILSDGGLGRVLASSVNQRDFPVVFAIAWVFVIIVALTKLAADLIEIATKRFSMQAVSAEPVTEQPQKRQGIPKGWLVFALSLVVVSIIVAIAGPLLAPYGWNEISIQDRLTAPSTSHLLGTDNVGRDILSRLLYGIRIDVFGLISAGGLVYAGILFFVAAGWAMLAEYFRRLISPTSDFLGDLIMLPGDIISSFPWLVLLLLLMSMLGPGGSQLVLVSSLVILPRAVNVIREASRSLPGGKGLFQSILLAVPVMLLFTVAGGILYFSTASYLGLGVPPPFPELGGMLSGAGGQFMIQAPWMALWPAIALILLLLIWVMAGEALLERLGFRSKAVWAKIME